MKKIIIFLIGLFPIFLIGQDLNGEWYGNNSGKFYLRQINNELWWYGDGGTDWSHVFHGKINGNYIYGDWADVPSGIKRNKGSMTIQIISSNELKRTWTKGGSLNTKWTRQNRSNVLEYEYWKVKGSGGWTAIWTCRGTSRKYDGLWTGPKGQKGITVIEITISGNQMTGTRTTSSDGILCDYTGQVLADGLSIRGTASCTKGRDWKWSAILIRK